MSAGDRDSGDDRRPRQWTADAPSREPAGGRSPAVPGKRNLIHETFGMPMRVADAPAQHQAKKPPQPMVAMTVRVRYHGKPDFIWRGASPTPGASGAYTATRETGSWAWDDDTGSTVRIYKNEADKVGRPIAAYMSDAAAYEVTITFGEGTVPKGGTAKVDTAGDDSEGDATASTDPHSAKDKSTTKGSTTPPADVSRDGDWQQLPDVADTEAKLKKPDQGGTSTTSSGTQPDAAREGDSEGSGDGDNIAHDGRTGGSARDASGNTSDSGRAGGQHGGSDRASLVHNPNAETGDAADANIPEDGAKKEGRAGGDAGKGDGGVAGGGALWKLIRVPAAIGPLVDLGLILKQADVAGLTDGIVTKAAQGLEGKALRAAIQEDVDRYAASEVGHLEDALVGQPEWEALDSATKAEKASEMKEAIKDETMSQVDSRLDQQIDELEADVQGADKLPDRDVGDAIAKDAREDLAATEKSLNEMQTVEDKAAKVAKKKNTTRQGVTRRNASDWREIRDSWDAAGYGEALSAENRALIKAGKVPHVDDAWIEHFPGDAALRGEPISIHHIGGGKLHVPLPKSRHMKAHMPGGYQKNPGGPGMTGSLEPGRIDDNGNRPA